MNNVPPIKSDAVSEEWIGDVRTIIRRDHRTVRGSPSSPMIELRSPGSQEWAKLMLPGSGFEFVSASDRDAVLRRLA